MVKLYLAGFTKAEQELLQCYEELVDEGIRENLDQKAAVRLRLAESTIRSRKSRLRAKYSAVLDFVKEYRYRQQRLYQKTGGKINPLGRR